MVCVESKKRRWWVRCYMVTHILKIFSVATVNRIKNSEFARESLSEILKQQNFSKRKWNLVQFFEESMKRARVLGLESWRKDAGGYCGRTLRLQKRMLKWRSNLNVVTEKFKLIRLPIYLDARVEQRFLKTSEEAGRLVVLLNVEL